MAISAIYRSRKIIYRKINILYVTLGKTMKLTEFNARPSTVAKKALKEHFNTSINLDKMSLYDTERMMRKVNTLMNEMRQKSNGLNTEQNPAYLKLVFMEQALQHHYGELRSLPLYNTRIVLENEEVEKSQVILAAQEMVDALQKMVEQVSDMLVKELPAVVDGVNSEVGTNEGEQFNTAVSEALTSLQASLTQSKGTLQSSLNSITGQGGDMAGPTMDMGTDEFGDMPPEGGEDMDALGGEEPDSDLPDLPEEPDETEPVAGVGRSTRK
jgi:hypothetical protein